jgi:hypothetical protein
MAKNMAQSTGQSSGRDSGKTSARSQSAPVYVERRSGPQDRRRNTEERRNLDRANDDFLPRRSPDLIDRRA